MKAVLRLLIVCPLLFAAAACGDEGVDPGSSGEPTTTAATTTIAGRTFLSTGSDGFEIVSGTIVRLRFDNGSVGASAGCNTMSGAYRLTGSTLVIDSMRMTEIGCEQPLMDQDQRLATLLTSRPTIVLDGDHLTVTSGAASITFTDREVADPDRPLTGTRWVLDTILEGDTSSSVPAGVTSSLTISDGRVAVEAGCNRGAATVEVNDGAITFGPLALTRMACDESKMSVERSVVATLSGSVGFTIEAGRLTLSGDRHGLAFRAED